MDKNSIFEQHLATVEQFRAENPGRFDTRPLSGLSDYSLYVQGIRLATRALTEAMENHQLERAEAAIAVLASGSELLSKWLVKAELRTFREKFPAEPVNE